MARTRRHDDDRDDILQDGQKLRVPMRLIDGRPNPDLDPLQRDVARHFARITDGVGRRQGLHQPGFRVNDAQPRDLSIYDAYDAAKSREWENPPTGQGSHGFVGAQAGDTCTVSTGGGRYGPEGSCGTLRRVDGQLV